MVPFDTEPGKTPRKIAIDRKKRIYLKQDIEEFLNEEETSLIQNDEFHFLPLESFDDSSYDPRTASEWLSFTVS